MRNERLVEFLKSGMRVYVEIDVREGLMRATQVTYCRPQMKTEWFSYSEADIRLVLAYSSREYKSDGLIIYIIPEHS